MPSATSMNPAKQSPRASRKRGVSFPPAVVPATQPRWNDQLQVRLGIAEENLHRSQKAWSPEQEKWYAEVEQLQAIKHAAEKFQKRRKKDLLREANKLNKASNFTAHDDEEQITNRLGGLLRRMSSGRQNGEELGEFHTSDNNDDGPDEGVQRVASQDSRREVEASRRRGGLFRGVKARASEKPEG